MSASQHNVQGATLMVAALCLALSVGVQGALLASPLLTMHVFDGVLQSGNYDTLLALALGFIFVIMLGGILRYLRALLVATATESAGQRLQQGALGAAVRGALAGDRTRGLAALGDAAEVRRLLGGAVASDVLDLLTVPAALAFLFMLHPLYGWTGLVGCALLAVLGALADRTTRQQVASANGAYARSQAALTGRLRSRDMVEGLGMLPDILRRWQPEAHAALELSDAAQRRARAIQGIAHFVGLLLQIAMVTVGAWLVARQDASPGSLLASMMLAGMASAPVSRVVSTWRDWAFGAAAWRRLSGFITQTTPPPLPPREPEAAAGLVVRGLTLSIPDGGRLLVRDLSFVLAPGEVLGLRGPNGVGKSTLLRALLGLVPVECGAARLDGADPRGEGPRIGYLPQGTQLLHGSVLDNIRRFSDSDSAAAVDAARRVGAHDAIGRLPHGYDTQAGHQGGLSGGQRQWVGLARAFFGSPGLIVLDEPEAGLDHAAIMQLRGAVQRAAGEGSTVLLVTHDPGEWDGVVTQWLDLEGAGAWRLSSAKPNGTNPKDANA